MKEYYKYIIEQLEFCEMITSIFKDEVGKIVEAGDANKCRELVDKMRKNVEHI